MFRTAGEKRDYGTHEMNETYGKKALCSLSSFSLFRYFRLFRNLSSSLTTSEMRSK